MALEGFLKIPGIDGESSAAGHEDEILVHGVHWKVEQGSHDARTGRSRAGAVVSAFTCQKYLDAASVYLADAVVNGKRFDEITFIAHAPGVEGSPVDYLTITMKDCSFVLVEDEHESHDPDDELIHETLVIAFDQVRITYVERDGDGGNGTEHEVEYGATGKRE